MMKVLRFFSALMLLIGVAAATTAKAQESTLDKVLKRGKVIVGVSSEAAPFGFIDEKANWSASTSISPRSSASQFSVRMAVSNS